MTTSNMKTLFSSKGKIVIMGLLFIALTTAFCFTAYAATTKTITINENGKTLHEKTHGKTVEEALKEKGILPQSHDVVSPNLKAKVKDGMTITWKPAVKVKFDLQGQTSTRWTTAKTVGDFLNQEGISVGSHDQISPSSDKTLHEPMIIQYEKGIKVSLKVGEKTQEVWTTPMTVKELLDQQNITVGDQDEVHPSLASKVVEGSKISVTRVTTKKEEFKESVDYKVIKETDRHLAKGITRVLTPGEKGERVKTYEVTYKNGKKVKKELVKNEINKTPKNKVVAVGTRVIHYSSPSTSRSLSGSDKTLYMYSTAYTANCKGCSGYTRTGINLRENPGSKIIAVDPSVIPLGTKVYVEGYGYAVAADTGGAIHGNRIDIFFGSESEANQWGHQIVRVRVLN
jgi:uncharacterized protein YabE (DUF348 family)